MSSITLRQPKLQMFGVWSALIYCVLFGIGWTIASGVMFPPISPSADEATVVALIQNNIVTIRVCMIFIMFAAMFMIPYAGALGSQICRIEGGVGVLTITVILGTFSNAIFTFYPPLWWLIASFRPDRLGAITYFLNDACWLQFVGAVSLFVTMVMAQGIAAFIDKSEDKIFPRWSGYFCMWVFVLQLPVSFIFFFHSGPFAWSGAIGFWLPAIVFFIYFIVTFTLMRSYIKRQVAAAKA